MTATFRMLACLAMMVMSVGVRTASAWNCDGHRVVAILAERLLAPATIEAVKAVLAASRADPALRRICDPMPEDLVADAATWADEERALDPSTAGWHFINYPLEVGRRTADHRPYCPAGNCVIDAIVNQFRVLRTSADAAQRANALRYIIHFVGDIHQPLHTITNGDRGGNCFPVTYRGQQPVADDRGNFSPNLHAVWDFNLVRSMMATRAVSGARALANSLAASSFPAAVTAREPTIELVRTWARGSNAIARETAYGGLPVKVPFEPAGALTLSSCDDNNHVASRLLALHERLDPSYERAGRLAVGQQLRLAGQRLAATLKAAFP